MGRKPKYSKEVKIQACEDYISGRKSAVQIAQELCMTKSGNNIVVKWAHVYKIHGESSFDEKKNNRSYSKEFKLKVSQEYLNGTGSTMSLAAKYNITHEMVRQWVNKYNSNIELKDYRPALEVYMKDTLKTTLDERIEIVQYCLGHDKDYKATCIKYNCKYAQLYQWIKKYERFGEEGLIDKRGKCKVEEELSELDKAQRKIAQLEREKEEYRKRYELLKKAEEIERRWY